jgi:transposase-like protein
LHKPSKRGNKQIYIPELAVFQRYSNSQESQDIKYNRGKDRKESEKMAKPYSQDFRKKVIAAIEMDGRKKGEVSEIFNISRNTIDLWLKRKEQTGDLEPKSTRPLNGSDKITDWEKFRAFAKENSSKHSLKWQSYGKGKLVAGQSVER